MASHTQHKHVHVYQEKERAKLMFYNKTIIYLDVMFAWLRMKCETPILWKSHSQKETAWKFSSFGYVYIEIRVYTWQPFYQYRAAQI